MWRRLLVSVVLPLECNHTNNMTSHPPSDLCLYWKCTSQEDSVGRAWLTQQLEVECRCILACILASSPGPFSLRRRGAGDKATCIRDSCLGV